MEKWCHLLWTQQQDASEFLMFFVDRVEKELALTDQPKIFNDFRFLCLSSLTNYLRFELQRDLVCGSDQTHRYPGSEATNTLSIEVSKMKDMNEALECYFQVHLDFNWRLTHAG